MDRTSTSNKENQPFIVPATPDMKRLGFGTGVGVFHVDRSPRNGHISSPWALKKIMRGKSGFNKLMGERLKNEADILRKLDHPNIVGFRAFVRTADGRECLAMEECHTSLGDLLEEKEDYFSSKIVQKVAIEVAKALDYIHNEVHLLHGDIKSHNILIKGQFDAIKLCDFGVSLKLTPEGEFDKAVVGKNTTYVGTEIWSATEVCSSRTDKIVITDKADIFSYGLTLWEMFTNQTPHTSEIIDESDGSFDEESYNEKLNQLLGTRPMLPPRVKNNLRFEKLVTLFKMCTEEDYKKRFSAKSVLEFCFENKF